MYEYCALIYIEVLCITMAIILPIFCLMHIRFVIFNTTTKEDNKRWNISNCIKNEIARIKTKKKVEDVKKQLENKEAELKSIERYQYSKSICQNIKEVVY